MINDTYQFGFSFGIKRSIICFRNKTIELTKFKQVNNECYKRIGKSDLVFHVKLLQNLFYVRLIVKYVFRINFNLIVHL